MGDAVREADKKRQEGLLRKVVSRMNHSLSAKRSRRRETHSHSHNRSSTRRKDASLAAQAVTPRNLRLCSSNSSTIRSAPSRSESLSSNSISAMTRKEYTFQTF